MSDIMVFVILFYLLHLVWMDGISRSIHVAAHGITSFFFTAE